MSPPTSLQPTQPYLSLTSGLWPSTPSFLLRLYSGTAVLGKNALLDDYAPEFWAVILRRASCLAHSCICSYNNLWASLYIVRQGSKDVRKKGVCMWNVIELAASCCIPRRSLVHSASATSVLGRINSSTFYRTAASTCGSCCRWGPPVTEIPRTRPIRPLRAITCC